MRKVAFSSSETKRVGLKLTERRQGKKVSNIIVLVTPTMSLECEGADTIRALRLRGRSGRSFEDLKGHLSCKERRGVLD